MRSVEDLAREIFPYDFFVARGSAHDGNAVQEAIRDALRSERERAEELERALEPFAGYADVRGGTPEANHLAFVIGEIFERSPYPNSTIALQKFCEAVRGARALLPTAKEAEK